MKVACVDDLIVKPLPIAVSERRAARGDSEGSASKPRELSGLSDGLPTKLPGKKPYRSKKVGCAIPQHRSPRARSRHRAVRAARRATLVASLNRLNMSRRTATSPVTRLCVGAPLGGQRFVRAGSVLVGEAAESGVARVECLALGYRRRRSGDARPGRSRTGARSGRDRLRRAPRVRFCSASVKIVLVRRAKKEPPTCPRHGEASVPIAPKSGRRSGGCGCCRACRCARPVNGSKPSNSARAGQRESRRSDLDVGSRMPACRAAGPTGCDSRPCRPGRRQLLMPVARWNPTAPRKACGRRSSEPSRWRDRSRTIRLRVRGIAGRIVEPLTAMTPPIASEPHSADCGPRTTSIREARSAFNISKRGVSPDAGIVDLDSVDEEQACGWPPRRGCGLRSAIPRGRSGDRRRRRQSKQRREQRLVEALDPLAGR